MQTSSRLKDPPLPADLSPVCPTLPVQHNPPEGRSVVRRAVESRVSVEQAMRRLGAARQLQEVTLQCFCKRMNRLQTFAGRKRLVSSFPPFVEHPQNQLVGANMDIAGPHDEVVGRAALDAGGRDVFPCNAPGERVPPPAAGLIRYFAALALLFARARRSVFLRRTPRFLTLSLPLQCPIGLHHTRLGRRCQAVLQLLDKEHPFVGSDACYLFTILRAANALSSKQPGSKGRLDTPSHGSSILPIGAPLAYVLLTSPDDSNYLPI